MSSLVSEFIINPVLRQARRFSEISRTTLVPEPDASSSDNLAVASDSEAPAPRHATDAPAVTPPDRPLSADTLSPTVEAEQPPSEPARAPPESFPITVPMQVPKREALPADDGMGALRKRLIEIQGQEIRGEEKARLMHEVLMEGYRKSRVAPQQGDPPVDALPAGEAWEQTLPSGPLESLKFWQHPPGEPSSPEKFVLTAEDVRPTYAPAKPTIPGEVEGARVLGCQHYKRNIKLQCSTCNKWYTCRFCHDAVEDHTLIRKETKNMLCMLCACPQRASEVCVNCGVTAARYYCNVCKLWDDDPTKSIYHCSDCGICRKGRGIGKDFFHCKVTTLFFALRGGLLLTLNFRNAVLASQYRFSIHTSVSNVRQTAIVQFVEITCSPLPSLSCSCPVVTAFTRDAMTNTCCGHTSVQSATRVC